MPTATALGRVVTVMLEVSGTPVASFDGFDSDVKIEMDSKDSTPNKCNITLFNLPEQYRSAFQKSGVKVRVLAGYKRAGTAVLGIYDVQRASSRVEGVDWITQVQAAEAMAAFRETLVSSTFPPGVNKATVYRQCTLPLLAYGVLSGNFDSTLGASAGAFANGITVEGRAFKLLEDFARKEGYFLSVQNHQLTFLEVDGASVTGVISVSPYDGLIGEPEYSDADPKMKKKAQVKCRSLLRHEARPGMQLIINLPQGQGFIRGQQRLTKVTHNLSTYAQPFYTDFESEDVSSGGGEVA